jgi:hypothetical protein
MNAIQRVIFLWGILSTSVLSAVISPTTCRPPLPIDWFISQAETLPEFSATLTTAFNTASGSLYKLIDTVFTTELNVDAISTVVSGPWGIVAEHYVGPLRSNDTTDHRIVQGDSSYRIASLSKVRVIIVVSDLKGVDGFGVAHPSGEGETLFRRFRSQIFSNFESLSGYHTGDVGKSNVWNRKR